jgi:phospholipase C
VFEGDAEFDPGPYGMGVRVPMVVISPWSKGGWVSSEVFDHTSLIRFIERRFGGDYPGLLEPNVTKWRRAVAGDLTSAFNFESPDDASVALPRTTGYVPPDNGRHPDYAPSVPAQQAVPRQEAGIRPARPVPYELHAEGDVRLSSRTVKLHFGNSGRAAAVFQVRSGNAADGPWTYTVGPHDRLSDTWTFRADEGGYDLSVYGPNGFLRVLKGSFSRRGRALVSVKSRYRPDACGITLALHNLGSAACQVRILNAYTRETIVVPSLDAGGEIERHFSLESSFGWYDLTIEVDSDPTFKQQLAGHVESGADSMTDPAIGA